MIFAPIENPSVLIKPSSSLIEFITTLKIEGMPRGVSNIRSRGHTLKPRNPFDHTLYLNDEDRSFINNLQLNKETDLHDFERADTNEEGTEQLLNLEDLYWLYDKLQENNKDKQNKKYFHEMFEGSRIVLPENIKLERNPDLEKRCKLLRIQQENRKYKAMTKNVDNVRQKHPEDTIAYQIKQINSHLIAIAQFIFSVLAGFAFGFIGVELIIGNLDFGFRLLLGIICALVIALAELYFLAKKLNEDLQFEVKMEDNNHKAKMN